jgi:hypothetical protein
MASAPTTTKSESDWQVIIGKDVLRRTGHLPQHWAELQAYHDAHPLIGMCPSDAADIARASLSRWWFAHSDEAAAIKRQFFEDSKREQQLRDAGGGEKQQQSDDDEEGVVRLGHGEQFKRYVHKDGHLVVDGPSDTGKSYYLKRLGFEHYGPVPCTPEGKRINSAATERHHGEPFKWYVYEDGRVVVDESYNDGKWKIPAAMALETHGGSCSGTWWWRPSGPISDQRLL